jgi:hypothetical protein
MYIHVGAGLGVKKVPFSQILMPDSTIKVTGLPPGMKFKKPSHYSYDDLENIISSKDTINFIGKINQLHHHYFNVSFPGSLWNFNKSSCPGIGRSMFFIMFDISN